jgi:hypothetical protein
MDANPVLRNTLAQIEKEFGEGSIMPLGSDAQAPIAGISSGSLSVDMALGGKGFPRLKYLIASRETAASRLGASLHRAPFSCAQRIHSGKSRSLPQGRAKVLVSGRSGPIRSRASSVMNSWITFTMPGHVFAA